MVYTNGPEGAAQAQPAADAWPPLLETLTGGPVDSPSRWTARRREIIERLLPIVYGPAPAEPPGVRCELLHAAVVRRLGGATLLSCRVAAEGAPHFALRVYLPCGQARPPVILNGDACWHHAGDEAIALMLGRGYAFAQFNRVELASDPPSQDRPASSGATGAIHWWAWGFRRAIDALTRLGRTDPGCIAVVGHSRGGKAALLAGALDERVALTSANNSGCGGAGSLRVLGPGAETLSDITREFSHWFAPGLASLAERLDALPFDQHLLKALVAPRHLLTTEARADRWANPEGTWHSHRAAQPVFDLLGAPRANAIAWRDGGHDHMLQDWLCLVDRADHVFRQGPWPGQHAVQP